MVCHIFNIEVDPNIVAIHVKKFNHLYFNDFIRQFPSDVISLTNNEFFGLDAGCVDVKGIIWKRDIDSIKPQEG